MEKAYGVVTKRLNKAYIQVKIDRKSMCGESCAACGGLCGLHDSLIRVKNTVGASVGDKVEVTVPTEKGVHAMLLAYGVPLLYMVLMAVCMAVGMEEKFGAALLAAGVLFWFLLLHFFEKKGLFLRLFQAEAVKIREDKA